MLFYPTEDDNSYDNSKRMKAQGKKFLTERGDEGGSIRWSIDGSSTYILSSLVLTDCSSPITLDFYCSSKSDVSKRIKKLDVLINELQEFRSSLNKGATCFDRPKYI